MKKLLNISVIAALAVLPMAANATVGEIVSVSDPTSNASLQTPQGNSDITAQSAPKYALAVEAATDSTNVATASYVKGAYNAAMKAINRVSETASNALTADGEATLTHKTIDANGTGNNITNIETDNFNADAIVTSTEAIKLDGTGSDTALTTEKAVAGAITTATNGMVTETGTQTLTNKAISGGTVSGAAISGGTVSGATITGGTIDADSTTISNLETDNFKSGVVRSSTDTIRASDNASDTALVTEKAVAAAIEGATTGAVTETGRQTLTNKTIDADDNTISDLTTSNLKSGVLVDSTAGIADSSTASDTKLVSEKAIAEAIADFATKAGVTATISASTVSGTVPTVTTWGSETTGTAVVTGTVSSAAYTPGI